MARTEPRVTRVAGAAVVVAVGGVVTVLSGAPGAPSADASTDPCAASEMAKTVGNVAINLSMYLDSHPETDRVLTAAAGQPAGPQTFAKLKTYFDANPQTVTDLQVIQRPVASLSTKCSLPVSVPQLLGLMQSVQAAPPAQVVSGPVGTAEALSSPGSATSAGR